jgi:cytochrome c oxidase subunit 2
MLFTRKGCIGCHALKGHEGAEGQMGPDLSKIAKERDREFLVAWIRDPQVLKPGSRMPALDLTSKEAEALADYLLSERPRKGKRR